MKIIAWDKSTDKAVIPERMPVDGEWARFTNGDSVSKKQYNEVTEKTTDELKSISERNWRDLELTRTDEFVKLPDYPVNLLPYRIDLRDYPSKADFPNGTRPII